MLFNTLKIINFMFLLYRFLMQTGDFYAITGCVDRIEDGIVVLITEKGDIKEFDLELFETTPREGECYAKGIPDEHTKNQLFLEIKQLQHSLIMDNLKFAHQQEVDL